MTHSEQPPGRAAPRTKLRRALIAIPGIAALSLLLVEGVFTAMLNHPALLPRPLLNGLSEYYMQFDRRVVQYVPQWARYDSRLMYTLRPGTFRVASREFDVVYHVNRLGVRDDEASLASPRIIVAGDSHAMGWGVAQDKTFAQLLEKETGAKVLNAGISSYGTAREMALLKRVDRSRLEFLVIQYSDNDYIENKGFEHFGCKLPILSEAEYQQVVSDHMWRTDYYFGKRAFWLIGRVARGLTEAVSKRTPSRRHRRNADDEAAAFLYAVANSGVALENVRIIVFEVNGRAHNDGDFVGALRWATLDERQPGIVGSIRVLDLSARLTSACYFLLDDHLNEKGHRVIAERLLPLLCAAGSHGARRPD